MKKSVSRCLIALLLVLVTATASIPLFAITASAATPASYTDIDLEEEKTVSVSTRVGKYFRFTPERGGTYEIYSYSRTGDPYVILLDSSGNQISSDDDDEDLNFRLRQRLEAGTTYYINACAFSDSVASYTFKIVAIELDAAPVPDPDPGYETDTWDGTTAIGFEEGSGTAENPYLIYTAEQLAYLAASTNSGTTYSGKHFKLMKNLDLADLEWTPIGSHDNSRPFSGTFDGNFATVSGLKITGEHESSGLFGYVSNASVKNIAVVDSNVDVYYHLDPSGSALVCGYASGTSSFSQIYASGSVKVYSNKTGNSLSVGAGLILGRADDGNSVTIQDSYATGEVYGEMTQDWNSYVGGIAGVIRGKIERSYFNGSVTSKGFDSSYAGGLAGILEYTASNSFAIGTVTATSGSKSAGGIASNWSTPTCNAAYYSVNCSPASNSYGTSTSVSNFTSERWITTNLGWDFENIWTFAEGCEYPVLNGFAEFVPAPDPEPDPEPTPDPEPAEGAHSEYNASTGDVFLGGNYIELGISKHGSFGTSTAPTTRGFHALSNYSYKLGFVVDEDGWDTGAAPTTKDFFLPGTPEERYILSYYYDGTAYEYKVAERNNTFTGSWRTAPTVRDESSGSTLRAVVTGETTHGVVIEIVYSFGVNDKFFTTEFSITNNGSLDITNLRFVRSFDPDQENGITSANTDNKVISNPSSDRPGGADNCAMVVARGTSTSVPFYFISYNNLARVSRGVEFSLSSAYKTGLWSATHSFPNAPTASALAYPGTGYTREDSNIAITFALGTLTRGASADGCYYSGITETVSEPEELGATPPTISSVTGADLAFGYTEGGPEVNATAPYGHILSYQWYINTVNSNSGGTLIPGATASSYEVPTGKSGLTEYYYCVVTSTRIESGRTTSVTTDAVTVTYEEAPIIESNKVLVIMDREPWETHSGRTSVSTMMNSLVTLDKIEDWDIASPSSVTATLLRDYAVVYVANEQDISTQSNIKGLKSVFEQYVRDGGVLIFGFVTMSSTNEYGNSLPGGVTTRYSSDYVNAIADSTHPIITGILSDGTALTNSDMTGSSASHDYIVESSLPAGSRVIVRDSSGRPTVAEYSIGSGTVIATGMTWDFYAYYSDGSSYGSFARKAYDDLFLYALSISSWTPGEHTHEESEWIVETEATCTIPGSRYTECIECNEILNTETIPALGHVYGAWTVDSEPTCTVSGTKYSDCTVCGEAGRIIAYIPALGHNYTSSLTRPATCTTPGIMTYECECGDTYAVYIYSEHLYEHTSRTEPTCTEDGQDVYTCARCGDSYSIPIAGGHNYIAEIVRVATPTTTGLVRYTCSICGDFFTEETPARIDANVLLIQDRFPWSSNDNVALLESMVEDGYIAGWDLTTTANFASVSLSDYNVVLIANDQTTATYNQLRDLQDSLVEFATAGGVVIYGACDNGWAGGDITYTLPEGVNKTNYYSHHNYIVDASHPIVLGTMTDGKALSNELLYGNYCSHTSFNIATLPAGTNVIIQDANGNPTLVEYAVGEGHMILSGLTWEFYYSRSAYDYRLNTTYTRNVYDDLIAYAASLSNACEHAWDDGTDVAPTCTEHGYTLHVCTLCEATIKENYVAALGHTPGDWELVTEPTAEEEGLEARYCTVCGEACETKVIPIIDAATIRVESFYDSVIVGQEITFTVVIEGADPVKSMALVPIFDSNHFDFVSASWSVDAFVSDIEEGTLRSIAAWASLTDVNTTVYTITLRAKALTNATTIDFTAKLQDNTDILVASVVGKTVAIIECPHAEVTYSAMDDGYHISTCTLCGYTVMEAHHYDDACDSDCALCGHVRIAPHAISESWCCDENGHWYECTLCGLHIAESAHGFDNASDTDCDECGYSRAALGDLDNDGDRDSDDAVLLVYIVQFGEGEYPKNQPIDFDGDGDEDSDDAIWLLYNTFYGDELYELHTTR